MEGADPRPAPLTEPIRAGGAARLGRRSSRRTDDEQAGAGTSPPSRRAPLTEPVEGAEPRCEVGAVERGAPSRSARSRRRRSRCSAAASPLLLRSRSGCVLVVLLGAVGWLVAMPATRRSRDDARQAALQAARQEAVNLTTISYETADADLGRIIASATGTLKTQFEAQRAQFPGVLARDKSVSVGTVLAAGVASQSSSTVEALVAVDAAVSNAETAKAGGRPLVKHYRMDMKLVLVGGRWLVSQVAFAGLPQ